MNKNSSAQPVFTPHTMNELSNLCRNYPRALLYAGGTDILTRFPEKHPLFNRPVIYLGYLKELDYIRRTESYLELGACASISRILTIGRHVLNRGLFEALSQIAHKNVRHLATFGGNLCAPFRRDTLYPILLLLDVQIEVRVEGKSNWLSLRKFMELFDSAETRLLVTRIRIPFSDWEYSFYRKTGHADKQEGRLTFCALAKTEKGVLSDIRLAIGTGGRYIFRSKEFEDSLQGRKLPLTRLSSDTGYNHLWQELNSFEPPLSPFQGRKVDGFLRGFLFGLAPSTT